ncbi:hypothetical protein FEK33_07720 [Nocardia asteroides NBRC 15531]|uniref:DUF304 domain-containing protein n=1 Tax=Nocardia asteroides NBRC 15531 TaxID=1110697 RepID=U5E4K3_NOCAS|nr:hypothetical protein [Nocardia asteroides]TLF70110.1 hypothetical protein FEK33_07720 [Nocardia asteroides NBRC 15531]UGT49636.1 hypothetical protein LT345_03210 [Nocardia asteroides]SFL96836.1 hypothetical protein SAMN05444423_1011567 [Nocardia asteroides]VEG37677.1 Uncharacterised protein [Nocardia asteroides]GAD84267.1 hypothetical protein NCAST_23_00250 [Nocardia asteroides NBRC 15531]
MRPIMRLGLRFVRLEIDIWVSLARAITRRPDTLGGTPIRYAGAVSAVIWAFVVVSAIEIPAVHVLIPWAPVRLAVLALGVWGLLWMLGMLAAHHMYPHVLQGDRLRVRYLRRVEFVIPLDAIRAVRQDLRAYDGSKSVRLIDTDVLAVPIADSTNVRVDLTAPHTFATPQGAVTVRTVVFWADDPRAAIAAIRATPERTGAA